MRILKYLIIGLLFMTCKPASGSLDLVPYPQKVSYEGEQTEVNIPFQIQADNRMKAAIQIFSNKIAQWNKASTKKGRKDSYFPVIIKENKQLPYGAESYELSINDERIEITVGSDKGAFYGMQTLLQLASLKNGSVTFPEVEIIDYPDFEWRSFMLDEARYFKGKDFVKALLDELAALKINKFHWHLTDDAGWRIEIKQYPKLTSVGAFRDSTQINYKGKKWDSHVYDGKHHGGFYTQKEIKEIIDYAADKNIQIIPEIEMPGHASAAIAAYPWLGVIGELENVPTYFGKLEDSYNVTDPRVIEFLHDVLDEVCELFPSDVIHIGGDEVLFEAWKNSPDVRAYMEKHNIKTPADLQIRFTNGISSYLEKKGKRMMGWNEILGQNIHNFENAEDYQPETELSKQSIIHFWRGEVPLISDAAQNGYEIVNSLHSETYLDYSYENLPLRRIYHFNPIPEGLDEAYHKNIIGIGTQMWSEWTPTPKDVEYQIFPRVAAFAEVGWSGTGDYENFVNRLKNYSERWIKRDINFPEEEIK